MLSGLTAHVMMSVMAVNRKAAPAVAASGRTAPTRPPAARRRKRAATEFLDDVAAKLQELERDVHELRTELAGGPARTDPFGVAGEAFAGELRSLLGDAVPESLSP